MKRKRKFYRINQQIGESPRRTSLFVKYRKHAGLKDVFVVAKNKNRMFSRKIVSKITDLVSITIKDKALEAEDVLDSLDFFNKDNKFKCIFEIKPKKEKKVVNPPEPVPPKEVESDFEKKMMKMARNRRNRRHRQRVQIIRSRHFSSPPIEKSFQENSLRLSGENYDVGETKLQGRRPYQEDFTSVSILPKTSVFSVFDGHIGPKTAKLAAEIMPKIIRKLLHSKNPQELFSLLKKEDIEKLDRDEFVKVVLRAAFLTVHNEIKKREFDDGCCASVILVDNKKIYTANLGDSRIMLFHNDQTKKPTQLTVDHNPTNIRERLRIELMGGKVNGDRLGLFNITRSLGDLFQKYLSRQPYISITEITAEHFGLVVASDGVWNFCKLEDIQRIFSEEDNPSVSAWKIQNLAFNSGSSDNISCITIKFKNV